MSNKFGVVLTDKRIVGARNGSIILNAKSCVTRLKRTGEFICAGMAGCNGHEPDIISYPVRRGVICDFDSASFMLKEYIKYKCQWYHRINLKVNFAIRGCLTETEIRALRNCYPNRANQTFYMQEIIASILGMDECIVIYVAYDFVEIALLRDCRIKHLFVKERAYEDLWNSIIEFGLKNNVRFFESSSSRIIGAYFSGDKIEVCGRPITNKKPQPISIDNNILSISWWLDKVKGYINDFIKEYGSEMNVYLMSDYENVNYLTHELSSRCMIKIETIDNALEKIAVNLSLR